MSAHESLPNDPFNAAAEPRIIPVARSARASGLSDSPIFDDLIGSLEAEILPPAPAPTAMPGANAQAFEAQAMQDLFGAAQMQAPSADMVDPEDKKAVCFALGVFRFQNWPCVELPDYQGFTTTLAYRDPLGRRVAAPITVFGRDGGLILTTPVMKITEPMLACLMPVVNMLNRISIGSMFVAVEGQVWVRLYLMPGMDESLQFVPEAIQHAMRQLVADMRGAARQLSLALMRASPGGEALSGDYTQPRYGLFDPTPELPEIERFARESGYQVTELGGELYACRALCPEDGAIQISLSEQVLFASRRLAHGHAAEKVSSHYPELRRCMRLNGAKLTPSQMRALLLALNDFNQSSGLVRYVAYHENQLAAVASRNMRLKPFSAEDLFFLLEALFAS